MVRVLSSGDIVPDDDPRAMQEANKEKAHSYGRGQGPSRQSGQGPRGSGDSGSTGNGPTGNNPYMGQTSQVSLYDAINNKLLQIGVPRIPVGSIVIEPVVAVAIMVSLLFFGWPGLMLIGLIYLIGRLSRPDNAVGQALSRFIGGPGGNQQNSAQNRPANAAAQRSTNATPGKKGQAFGGKGYKLGH